MDRVPNHGTRFAQHFFGVAREVGGALAEGKRPYQSGNRYYWE